VAKDEKKKALVLMIVSEAKNGLDKVFNKSLVPHQRLSAYQKTMGLLEILRTSSIPSLKKEELSNLKTEIEAIINKCEPIIEIGDSAALIKSRIEEFSKQVFKK